MSRRPNEPSPGGHSGASVLAALLTAFLLAIGCHPGSSAPGGIDSDAGPSTGTASTEIFVDATEATGLDYVNFNGMSGELYIVEEIGPGAALFDADGDGDLDLYIPQGHMLGPGKTVADATFPPPPGMPLTDRLYRNDLEVLPDGTRSPRFTDVTEASGIVAEGYGIGVATGDVDNDGLTDLYVTNWGPNQLWRNLGDGRFTNTTKTAGVAGDELSTSAAFVDLNRDGWLDLYVANYIGFRYANHTVCTTKTGLPDYCGPLSFTPRADRLYLNRGNGTFADASETSGISAVRSNGLGVVSLDADNDGWLDLYVANDAMANTLWRNLGDGRFTDTALLAGCALSRDGMPEGSMGVSAGDLDGDGDEDLVVAHMRGELNRAFVNRGNGLFDDRSSETGLGGPSLRSTTYGVALADYDNDGWLDLLASNGAMMLIEADVRNGDSYAMREANSLYHNRDKGSFVLVDAAANPALALREVGRGAAFGDLDDDGDVDWVECNSAGPTRVLLNRMGQDREWMGLRLVGPSGRDMLGAEVEVRLVDGTSIFRRSRTDGSYCSANDPRILIGLSDRPAVGQIRVRWPDGSSELFGPPPRRSYTVLKVGAGKEGEPRP
jgi:hypothetical protein